MQTVLVILSRLVCAHYTAPLRPAQLIRDALHTNNGDGAVVVRVRGGTAADAVVDAAAQAVGTILCGNASHGGTRRAVYTVCSAQNAQRCSRELHRVDAHRFYRSDGDEICRCFGCCKCNHPE